jgi:hypothetical protein
MPPTVLPLPATTNPQRTRAIAKKTAPSHYSPPRPPRADSPMSLDDQLLFIERWGVDQKEACTQCRAGRRGTRCVLAEKISPKCRNCLRAGKECRFESADADTEEEESELEEVIFQGRATRTRGSKVFVANVLALTIVRASLLRQRGLLIGQCHPPQTHPSQKTHCRPYCALNPRKTRHPTPRNARFPRKSTYSVRAAFSVLRPDLRPAESYCPCSAESG